MRYCNLAGGITRFTAEDGTVDYEAVIAEFRRQWGNFERGSKFLKERAEAQGEHDRAALEEQGWITDDAEGAARYDAERASAEQGGINPYTGLPRVADEHGEIFFARALVDGKETAVAEGYPLSMRDARDPEKVLKVLSPLVGKSAAQLGELKLTRINAKSMEHTLNSEYARWQKNDLSKKGKRLWRGRVGGLSVLDDLIATSPLGDAEAPKHYNYDWKKDAKFYRSETRFAIKTEQGYEVYPCQLLVAELKNGERYVYDLVEIKEPTLSASIRRNAVTVGRAERDLPTGESVASPHIVPNSGAPRQGGDNGKRYSVGDGGSGAQPPSFGRVQYVRHTRVPDDADGRGERSVGGLAASAELMRTGAVPLTTRGTRFVALPLSEIHHLAGALGRGRAAPSPTNSQSPRPSTGT